MGNCSVVTGRREDLYVLYKDKQKQRIVSEQLPVNHVLGCPNKALCCLSIKKEEK